MQHLQMKSHHAISPTMQLRAVIFDLDGVLVSTDGLHYQGWKRLADEEGIPFDETINHRLRGVSRMESLEILLERSKRSYSLEEIICLKQQVSGPYADDPPRHKHEDAF